MKKTTGSHYGYNFDVVQENEKVTTYLGNIKLLEFEKGVKVFENEEVHSDLIIGSWIVAKKIVNTDNYENGGKI